MPSDPTIENSSKPCPFADEMRFTKPWRPYQAQVLEKLPQFLHDRHFHLISAPGSGKTVIGWEVLRRVGKPTLVLAPTIAIREQWIERLRHDFLDGKEPDWISREIEKPALVTISTYQSLSTAFRNESRGSALLETLKTFGVSVLVVDEAHHLRAVWWKCLALVKSSLTEPTTIALTATPPIDVPQAEWNRYATFCGEVDLEVGVPELVAEGNLCPHQDYVLLSIPEGSEVDELQRFHEGIEKLILDLQLDIEFAESLGRNAEIPWIQAEDSREAVRQQQAFFFSLAGFLQHTGGYLPLPIAEKFKLTGEELPTKLDRHRAETLLQGLLFDFRERIETAEGTDENTVQQLKGLENRLRDLGGIEKGRVVLQDNEENEKLLRNSPAKLQSIAQIIEHELDAQSILMRAVVLTDHIRKDAFPTPGVAEPPLVKLGVVPIFEMLRRMRIPMLLPAVLTGSLIIIPESTTNHFRGIASDLGISPNNLRLRPLDHDESYSLVDIRDSDRQRAVSAVTELFQQGEINCLIGTAALLGEGWDAPAVNTLVLASIIGSFVMSNQMRGRAIRSDAGFPDKTANIWHIATVPPEFKTGRKNKYDAGKDYRKLQRRFEAFHGVGFGLNEEDQAIMENGWTRLGIPGDLKYEKIEEINRTMFQQAEDRPNMQSVWNRAVAPAIDGRFLRPVRTLTAPRRIATNRFIARIAGSDSSGIRYGIAGWLEKKRLRRIAIAIFKSLQDTGHIDSTKSPRLIRAKTRLLRHSLDAPHLENLEQAVFVESLGEFFDVFSSNPRYLIQQKNSWAAVPKRLGENQQIAKHFSRRLRRQRFGRHQLHYVHSRTGKDHLLEARKQVLLQQATFQTETRVRWEASD